MSQKQIKRKRKEIRRVINKNFGEGLASLSNIVRPRPRYIPNIIWIVVYAPLFPKRYLKVIYKELD